MTSLRRSVLVLVLVVAGGLTAQSQQFREPAVSFSVAVVARALNYTVAEPDTKTILSDRVNGPLRVQITVANSTGSRVDIGTTASDWLKFVSARLVADPNTWREEVPDTTIALLNQAPPGALTVESDGMRTFQAELRIADRPSLGPGLYELRVVLDPAALSPFAKRFGNMLSSTTRIRVKQPVTPDEVVDMCLQRWFQSRIENRRDECRKWAERALALNPFSIPAVLDVASDLLEEGNCAEAAPRYKKAIRLLNTGGDPRLLMDDSERQELVTFLQGKLAVRCGRTF